MIRPQQGQRHLRARALERDLVDAARVQRREYLLVLAPLAAEGLLPVEVLLDAVAVADVRRRRALQSVDGLVQGLDAPVLHVLREDVEGGLVELDHVDAGLLELAGLLVQDLREGHGHLRPAAVVGIGDRVADGHRAGQGELQFLLRLGAGEFHLVQVHRRGPGQRPGDRRDFELVAIVPDAHERLLLPVDAADLLEEAVHEVDAEHLAVGDDVDAGLFLVAQPLGGRAALAVLERLAGELPAALEFLGLGEPVGARQAAGDGRFKHLALWSWRGGGARRC